MQQTKKRTYISLWACSVACLLVIGSMIGGLLPYPEAVSVMDQESIAATQQGTPPKLQVYELPLYFEKNEGQIATTVKYLSRGKGYTFYFTPQEIVIALNKKFNG